MSWENVKLDPKGVPDSGVQRPSIIISHPISLTCSQQKWRHLGDLQLPSAKGTKVLSVLVGGRNNELFCIATLTVRMSGLAACPESEWPPITHFNGFNPLNLTPLKFLKVHSIIYYIYIIVQQMSRAFSSCKTETVLNEQLSIRHHPPPHQKQSFFFLSLRVWLL